MGFRDNSSARYLVTGASGPLGSAVVRRLVDENCSVAALMRPTADRWRLAGIENRLTTIYGNLERIDECAGAIRKFAPDTVIHAAWQGVGREARHDPVQITINVPGTLRLLEIALAAGMRSWIGIGSQAEYGLQAGPLQEDLRPNPAQAYGLAKLCAGQLTLERCRLADVRPVWLRLLATYGPADDERRLIPYLIRTLTQGGTAHLSAGTQKWDYLFLDDAVEAILAMANCSAAGVFNLASGSAWNVRRIAELVQRTVGTGRLEFDTATEPASLEADISRIVAATGWRPSVDMQEGLRRTVEWYRSTAPSHDQACTGGSAW